MKTEQIHWSAATGWTPDISTLTLGVAAQLVFAFGEMEAVLESDSLELAHRLYPNAHIVGCGTCAVIHGGTVTEHSVCLTAVSFAETTVVTARATIAGPDQSYEAGVQLARGLPLPGLTAVLLFSEGLKVRGSQLVRGIASVLPPRVVVCGGCASDGDRGQQTFVWCDGPPEAGVVAVGFYGARLRVSSGATGRWGPFGPNRLVTRASGNVLYELDGRPALGVYKLYLGELAASLPASALLFPMMVRERSSERQVLRALLAIDEHEQSIVLAGDIEEGSRARLMRGTLEHLIAGTVETARSMDAELASAELAILVSCYGRFRVLKQRVEEEIDAVLESLGEHCALAGFYSYGEISPLAVGEAPELHNETMVIVTLAEG